MLGQTKLFYFLKVHYFIKEQVLFDVHRYKGTTVEIWKEFRAGADLRGGEGGIFSLNH